MGNMSDEMKKIMSKWNSEPQPQDSITNQLETKGQSMNTETKFPTIRAEIYDYIEKHPRTSAASLLKQMQITHPTITESSISSQLTTMFQGFMLTREQMFDQVSNKNVYVYYAADLEVAEKMREERKAKLLRAQQRAERARQVKAERAKQRELDKQKQIPLPFEGATVTASEPTSTVSVVSQAPALHNMTALQILQSINFTQAKDLYKELKDAFGG